MLTEWKICRQVPIWGVGVWNITVTFQQMLIVWWITEIKLHNIFLQL
jgi:hypothetical protein